MKTLILSGYGTNCEKETAHACRLAAPTEAVATGVEVRHITEIYRPEAGRRLVLDDYHFLVCIGGFLDGDDLGGGRACANRFRYWEIPGGGTFREQMQVFVEDGRLVLGICNGFQLLVKLGLLPGRESAAGYQEATLGPNANGRFEDRWVRLAADEGSPCVFTRGLGGIELPIRHGEGRLIGAGSETLPALVEAGLVPLRYAGADGAPTEEYPANPNGAPLGAAALCNPAGTVMGLMPHPEAYHHRTNHPRWTRMEGTPDSDEGEGLRLFRNAYRYLTESDFAAA